MTHLHGYERRTRVHAGHGDESVDPGDGGSGLVWIPMPELSPLEHFIAWRSGEGRSHVTDFVEIVVATFVA